jgi:mannose-1-phosphate guanylyltransferase/mannose-6-phosphate isomerase
VPVEIGWNDVGSWSALWEIGRKDAAGNVTRGDVMLTDVTNSYVRSDDRLVAAIGVDDLIIVATDDAVLVASKDRVQDVRAVTDRLKSSARTEHELHTTVYRPWGSYQGIGMGERYQVKRIVVRPGGRLSLQKHAKRAEHWVVVRGTATITRGEETTELRENESTYIPRGVVHRLENRTSAPLTIIEVQSGGYLGEDDIVRLDDSYGRN